MPTYAWEGVSQNVNIICRITDTVKTVGWTQGNHQDFGTCYMQGAYQIIPSGNMLFQVQERGSDQKCKSGNCQRTMELKAKKETG